MSGMQRYDCEICDEYASTCEPMRKSKDGDWVTYDAHAAALAAAQDEIERLKCENEDLRAQVITGETGQQILLQGNARLQARIEELEGAVKEALTSAEAKWESVGRRPASRFTKDVKYFREVLNPKLKEAPHA